MNRYLAQIILFITLFSVSFYLFYNQVFNEFPSDLPSHISFTIDFLKSDFTLLHPFFHYCIYYFSQLFAIELNFAAIIVLSLFMAFIGLIQYQLLYLFLRDDFSKEVILLATFLLMTVTAIYLPFFNKNIYLGQWSPNVWHNPTTIMVKPFAFLSLIFIVNCFKNKQNNTIYFYLATMVLMFISTFAKPNFVIAFIPALFIFIFVYYTKEWDKYLKVFLITLPTLAVLIYQYSQLGSGTNVDPIIIDFLGVWNLRSPNPLISFFLLTAFPISIIVFYRKAFVNRYLTLSWIVFGIALLQFMVFAQDGPHYKAGNFGWGLMITIPLVFLFSLVEYLKWAKKFFNKEGIVDLFRVWNLRSPKPFISLHLLMAFPINVLLFCRKSFNRYLTLCCIVLGVALIHFTIFTQDGLPFKIGALKWVILLVIIMLFVFYVIELIKLFKKYGKEGIELASFLNSGILLSLHFVSGLLYLFQIFGGGSYR